MKKERVLVTGGAGYVGCVLVPKLLEAGYFVRVLDLMTFGDNLTAHPNLEIMVGDIRSVKNLADASRDIDAVIHLACISNDPSCDLEPILTKSINYDAFPALAGACYASGVKRFIYASSSSVYGVSDAPNVDETLPTNPLTDYSKSKVYCEKVLQSMTDLRWTTCIVRPATVCGYSTRQRFDVIVNALARDAFVKGEITIHGGKQFRPNIHIDDMCDFYLTLFKAPHSIIHGEIFNAGGPNYTIEELADIVKNQSPKQIKVTRESTYDQRSYRISSLKALSKLGWKPKKSIRCAVQDIYEAFSSGKFDDPYNMRYSNIEMLRALTELSKPSSSSSLDTIRLPDRR